MSAGPLSIRKAPFADCLGLLGRLIGRLAGLLRLLTIERKPFQKLRTIICYLLSPLTVPYGMVLIKLDITVALSVFSVEENSPSESASQDNLARQMERI